LVKFTPAYMLADLSWGLLAPCPGLGCLAHHHPSHQGLTPRPGMGWHAAPCSYMLADPSLRASLGPNPQACQGGTFPPSVRPLVYCLFVAAETLGNCAWVGIIHPAAPVWAVAKGTWNKVVGRVAHTHALSMAMAQHAMCAAAAALLQLAVAPVGSQDAGKVSAELPAGRVGATARPPEIVTDHKTSSLIHLPMRLRVERRCHSCHELPVSLRMSLPMLLTHAQRTSSLATLTALRTTQAAPGVRLAQTLQQLFGPSPAIELPWTLCSSRLPTFTSSASAVLLQPLQVQPAQEDSDDLMLLPLRPNCGPCCPPAVLAPLPLACPLPATPEPSEGAVTPAL
jgi:uncharacterized protein YsxB (DUF464 family)